MIETNVEIPGIAAEALFFRPDDVAEFPGVVFLTDIWGIRPANIGVARRLAERGFAVLMPNVFHRYSRIAPDGFEHGNEEERTGAMHALLSALTPEQMASDGKAYIDFLLVQKGVMPGKAAIVGYCFTGQMAVRTAAAVPDKIAAAASFHGGFLVTDKPDSPHKIFRPSRRGFISAMRWKIQPRRRSRSKSWKRLCGTGMVLFKPNSMKARCMAGPCPAVTSTTNYRQSAPLKSLSSFWKPHSNNCGLFAPRRRCSSLIYFLYTSLLEPGRMCKIYRACKSFFSRNRDDRNRANGVRRYGP